MTSPWPPPADGGSDVPTTPGEAAAGGAGSQPYGGGRWQPPAAPPPYPPQPDQAGGAPAAYGAGGPPGPYPPGVPAGPYPPGPYPSAPPLDPYGYRPPPGPSIASPGARLLARLVDSILVGVVASILASAWGLHLVRTSTGTGTSTFDTADLLKWSLVVGLVGAVYEISLIALTGATLGKRLARIRVLRVSDGQVPGWSPAAIRWALPSVPGLVGASIIGLFVYLSLFLDSTGRRRGWHDKAAGTMVVRSAA